MNRKFRKRKSGFLTFCFSFLPGAGEMYLGFMRMGISLMGLFFAIISLAVLLNFPTLFLMLVVVWFYSFFHVHNLAGLTDEEFLNTKDEFLFHLDELFHMDSENAEKYRKIVAIVLIAVGVLLLWNGMRDMFFAYLPDAIWRFIVRLENRVLKILVGIVIIAGGMRMIKGKEEELKEVTIDVESVAADVVYGRNTQPDREMGLYGRNTQPDREAGFYGRNTQPDREAGLYGKDMQSDREAGLYGKDMQSDREVGLYGKGMQPDREAGLYGKDMQSDREAGFHGKDMQVEVYGANTQADVIYGMDLQAGGPERSGYGKGQADQES